MSDDTIQGRGQRSQKERAEQAAELEDARTALRGRIIAGEPEAWDSVDIVRTESGTILKDASQPGVRPHIVTIPEPDERAEYLSQSGTWPASDAELAEARGHAAHALGANSDAALPFLDPPPIGDNPSQWAVSGRRPLSDAEAKTLEFQRPPVGSGEVRIVNEKTGGAKGRKPQRFELVPFYALARVAEVYAFGADKYDDHNWRKGYDWSLSFGAAMRHLAAFWEGEDNDPESGLPHVAHAAFHLNALLVFQEAHPELDDRPRKQTGEDGP